METMEEQMQAGLKTNKTPLLDPEAGNAKSQPGDISNTPVAEQSITDEDNTNAVSAGGQETNDEQPSEGIETVENTEPQPRAKQELIEHLTDLDKQLSDNKHTDIKIVDYNDLPSGVTHPQGTRNKETAKMKPDHLTRRIRHYTGATWVQSPEYAEQIYRLLTMTVKKLEASGMTVPAWKKMAEVRG